MATIQTPLIQLLGTVSAPVTPTGGLFDAFSKGVRLKREGTKLQDLLRRTDLQAERDIRQGKEVAESQQIGREKLQLSLQKNQQKQVDDKIDFTTKIRQEVSGLKQTKDAVSSVGTFNKSLKLFEADPEQTNNFLNLAKGKGAENLEKFRGNLNAVGDIGLIFNFMKSIDPTSTVREGEFATAAQTGGIADTVRNTYNKLLEGTRLTDNQRLAFLTQIRRQAESAVSLFESSTQTQRTAAEAGNIPFDQVFPELGVGEISNLGLFEGDTDKKPEKQIPRFNAKGERIR